MKRRGMQGLTKVLDQVKKGHIQPYLLRMASEMSKTYIDNRWIIGILVQARKVHTPYECSQFVNGLESIDFSQARNVASNGFQRFRRRMKW
jgi:hypothetical protein